MSKKLIITDLDNTIFDWVGWHTIATKATLLKAAELSGASYQQLCEEYKAILDKEDCVEYPFALQRLPSLIEKYDSFDDLLTFCVEPARKAGKLRSYPYIKPYPNVIKTLDTLKKDHPDVKLVVLTDAPSRMGLWRLQRMGLLHYFDGVYGLEDPKLPVIGTDVVVSRETLLKNLELWKYGFIGRHRILPNDYRKPDPRGFKNILMDFNLEKYNKQDVLFVGDNVYKDVRLGIDVGITTGFAKYGIDIDPDHIETLKEFSPARLIHKGIKLEGEYPQADHVLTDFAQILKLL